ncbi:MAG: hypothetical protein ACREEW_08165 [Caulobacteraceae bacterium]
MRPICPWTLAMALALAPGLAFGQTATNAAAKPTLLTPQQQGRQGVVKGVAEQPLRDLNLMHSKIPPVLTDAMADAYRRPADGCPAIQTEVEQIDSAIGPDLDKPVSTESPGLVSRGESAARNASLDAMRAGLQGYIPFDGYIRMLTGADRHDRLVLKAIEAGAIRRAYLKGVGEARGCAAPAAPLHLANPVALAEDRPAQPRR